MNKIIIFLGGALLGIFIGLALRYLPHKSKYLVLKKDYCIEDIGRIMEGSILKFDKPFPEGFSRYVLYINISDAENLDDYQTDKNDIVIPYWLRENDTICVK